MVGKELILCALVLALHMAGCSRGGGVYMYV